MRLTPQNLSLGIDGDYWIMTSRKKTNQPVRVPLLPKARELVEKCKNHPRALATGTMYIVFAHDHGTSYQSPPASNYSYVVAGKSITPKDQGNPAGTESGNEDGPQIRQAPDATMNASVIPADQAIFTLIAILLLMVKGTIPLSQDPPRQTLFHQILFRVIISPNAP